MSFQVKLTVHASEVARELTPEIKKAAKKALRQLEENPDLGKELQAELTGFRSYRFMRNRIVYRVLPAKKIVVVWAVGHRRDIYENFSDQLVGKR
jgi:mRNA interferase RelE/StbE